MMIVGLKPRYLATMRTAPNAVMAALKNWKARAAATCRADYNLHPPCRRAHTPLHRLGVVVPTGRVGLLPGPRPEEASPASRHCRASSTNCTRTISSTAPEVSLAVPPVSLSFDAKTPLALRGSSLIAL